MIAVLGDGLEEVARRTFQISSCLGRGGFGEVYKATMRSAGGLESEVAVKVLRGDVNPSGQALERLRDEGRLLARLNHPAILRVYDLVLLDGHISLVTEYVDGQDLGECMHGEAPIGLRGLLEVVGHIASALDAAYGTMLPDGSRRLEIVHRDIKPSNIRISRHGNVKLLDFGIARTDTVDREARTQTDLMVGSPAYMAPERFLEHGARTQSDVFALGCSLYEGLVHTRVYEDTPVLLMSTMALDDRRYVAHMTERFSRLAAEVPDSVRELIGQCLAYDWQSRPSPGDLAARCEELADEVGGPSLSRWCRSRAWPALPDFDGPLEGRTITEGSLSRGLTGQAKRRTSSGELGTTSAPDETVAPERDSLTPQETYFEADERFKGRAPTPRASPPAPPDHPVSVDIPAHAPRSRLPLFAVGGLLVVLIVLVASGLVGGGALWANSGGVEAEPVEAALAVDEIDVPAPEPVVTGEQPPPAVVEDEPTPRPVAKKPAQPKKERVIVPAAPPEPTGGAEPQPEPPAPVKVGAALGSVALSSKSDRVPIRLTGPEGAMFQVPAEVSEGRYVAIANFNGGSNMAFPVDVKAGRETSIKCVESMDSCVVLP
jgi:serine/threonine protein kinase